MKIDLNIEDQKFRACSMAYTIFCQFIDYERDNMCENDREEFKKTFLFLLLRDYSTKTDSDFLQEDLKTFLS